MERNNQAVFGNSVIFREITSNLPHSDLKDLRLVSRDFNSYVLEYSNFVNRTTFRTTLLSIPVLNSTTFQFRPKHIDCNIHDNPSELEEGSRYFEINTNFHGLHSNLSRVETYFSSTFCDFASTFLQKVLQNTETKLIDLALTDNDWTLLFKTYSVHDLHQKLCNLKALKIFESFDSKFNPQADERTYEASLALNLPSLQTFVLSNLGDRAIHLAITNLATITSLSLNDIVDLNSPSSKSIFKDLKFPNLKKLKIDISAGPENQNPDTVHLIKNHISQLTHLTFFTVVSGIDDDSLWSLATSTVSEPFKLKEISIIAQYIQFTRNTPKFFAKLQSLTSIWIEVPLKHFPPPGGVHLNIVEVLAMIPATTNKVNLVCIPCENVERRSFRFLLEGFPRPPSEYAAAENLTDLKIRFENGQDDNAILQRVFKNFVNLKRLSLQNLSCCTYLGFTGASLETGQPVPTMFGIVNLQELLSLSLYGEALTDKMLLDGLKLPKLKYLDLTGNWRSVETYRQLAVQNPLLTELHTNPPPPPGASKIPPSLLEGDSLGVRQVAWKYPYRP